MVMAPQTVAGYPNKKHSTHFCGWTLQSLWSANMGPKSPKRNKGRTYSRGSWASKWRGTTGKRELEMEKLHQLINVCQSVPPLVMCELLLLSSSRYFSQLFIWKKKNVTEELQKECKELFELFQICQKLTFCHTFISVCVCVHFPPEPFVS